MSFIIKEYQNDVPLHDGIQIVATDFRGAKIRAGRLHMDKANLLTLSTMRGVCVAAKVCGVWINCVATEVIKN
jgi:hypothetical protein